MTKFGSIPATSDLAASDMVFTPTGTIQSTDAQSAIAEVASEAGGSGTGLVAFTSLTTNVLYSATSDTDLALTIGAVSGKAYQVSFHGVVSASTQAAADWTITLTDGTDTFTLGRMVNPSSAALGTLYSIDATVLYTPTTSGSKTLKVRLVKNSGTNIYLSGDGTPRQLSIELVGQVSPPSAPALGLIANTSATTGQSISTTADDVMTLTASLVGGAGYQVHYIANWTDGTTADIWDIQLRSPSVVQALGQALGSVGGGAVAATAFYTPAASGSATLSVRYFRNTGSGTLVLAGSATTPRQLWIERVA